MMMDNTAVANDFDQELFSELKEPLVQPLLVHVVALFVDSNGKNFSGPANERETFVGMEEVRRKFKETVCGPPSKPTRHWICTGGISL